MQHDQRTNEERVRSRYCGHELHGYRAIPYICELPPEHEGPHGAITDTGELSWTTEGLIVEVKASP